VASLLFVSYSGVFGGAERVLLDCAGAVGEPLVACPEGALAARARAAGIDVVAIRGHRPNVRGSVADRLLAPARLLAHALELRALARRVEPDAVVGWGMRSAIACLGLPERYPVAIAHHDMLPGPLIASALRRAARRAMVVIVPSAAVALDLDPGGRLTERLRVVNPGVDLERFAAPRAPVDPPEVLVLGALVAWKRPDLALEACALARRAVPELRLRVAGAPLFDDETVLRRLRERAAAPDLAGAVEIVGHRIEPGAALARSACLLHCAPAEPFGLAVVEALAAGCPAVVPASGGPAEIVDERCALAYPPGDVAAAARAIVEVVSDSGLAARMGEAGRRRAQARFDRSRTMSLFADALVPMQGDRGFPKGSASDRDTPGPGRLALVTVTRNSRAELEALLASVARHLPGAEVVVVDNDSSDGSLEAARRWPFVTAVALGRNVGFGTACNRGLEKVCAPVTALVNPDVELLDDSLLDLCSEALRDDRAERLLAPLVLRGDLTRQDSVHPTPTSAADLIASVVSPAVVPTAIGAALWPWRSSTPRRVGWAIGAALVARTETLRRLGPFDETIFLYGEDLDLGLRAARNGVQTWFWPSGRVVHHGAHAARSEFGGEPFERLARGRHEVVARRLGRRRAAIDDRAQEVTFALRLAAKRALGRAAERERLQLRAVRALGARGGRL
jgi:N-acetylglucosaminyl-diphospho-decaprenol L-rhamnosyltransferase